MSAFRGLLAASAIALVTAFSATPAAADWLQPPLTLETGDGISSVDAVTDDTGRGTVGWAVDQKGTDVLRFRRIDAAGNPGPIADLSDPADGDADDLVMDATPGGEVVAVWSQGGFEAGEIKMRRISPSGSLGPIVDVAGAHSIQPHVDADPSGFAYIAWMRFFGGAYRLEGRAALANGTLGMTHIFSSGAPSSFEPQLAIGSGGTTLITWHRSNPESQIQGRIAVMGGVPGELLELGGGAKGASGQRVAARPDGSFAVVYSLGLGAPSFESVIQRRIVSPVGALSPLLDVSPAGDSAAAPQIAVGPDGTASVVWLYRKENTDEPRLDARRLLPDGGAGPALPAVSTGGGNIEGAEVEVDGSGNAIVTWSREKPLFEVLTRRIFAGGAMEPAGEQILSAPSEANPREALLNALDVSSTGSAIVAFLRSGGGQPDDQVQALRFVPPGPLTQGAVADTTRPLIRRLRLTPRVFRVGGGRRKAKSSRKRRRIRRGTRIRFRASEPLRATLLVQRRLPGRRLGRRCVPPRHAKPRAKRCARHRRVFTFTRNVPRAGKVVLRFSGRLRKRKLRPGRYRLSVTGVDRAGNRTARPRRAGFRVVGAK
ncbi:MAG TPA: hypothetical protein VFZ41_01530 [Solirubrobacterales bacterium]